MVIISLQASKGIPVDDCIGLRAEIRAFTTGTRRLEVEILGLGLRAKDS